MADFIELVPALLDIHPSVHTVISHSGPNDVMSRQLNFTMNLSLWPPQLKVWGGGLFYLVPPLSDKEL